MKKRVRHVVLVETVIPDKGILQLLYHVFKNRDVGTDFIREARILEEVGVIEVPQCRVLAVDRKKIIRKTLWGEANTVEELSKLDVEGRVRNALRILGDF